MSEQKITIAGEDFEPLTKKEIHQKITEELALYPPQPQLFINSVTDKEEGIMTEQKHTAEPWSYDADQSETGIEYTDSDGLTGAIAYVYQSDKEVDHEANAKRIVECVNAMEGIEDPERFCLQAERLARYVQVKGHHDTCSHALVPDTQCNCGYDQALALFPTPTPEGDNR